MKEIERFFKKSTKKIKFDEYYNCLYGEQYRKQCNNYVSRSINHEMYL